MWREVQRLKNDPSVPLVMLIVNFFEALIIASIFYGLPTATSSFFQRGGILFMMVSNSDHASLRTVSISTGHWLITRKVLLNAFGSILEIMSLYAKRTIVEKVANLSSFDPHC
tara:strand:+ start:4113 stop:4451 length:339 start_codon:yes stop_codon:yes gene_type:complete